MEVTVDVLGPDYEAIELPMGRDAEGEVVATLVRRRGAESGSRRAVLYLHGFVDYFFQTHLADFYVELGFDFYALDLRKYGRSLRPHQTPNFVESLTDYFPEIDEAVRIVRDVDGHGTLLLNGHSTGGLVAALWADRVKGKGLVDGLFLNSPFLDIDEPAVMRGRRRPRAGAALPVPQGEAAGRPVGPVPAQHPPRPRGRVGLRPGVEADRRVPGAGGVAGGGAPGAAPAAPRASASTSRCWS